LKACPFVLLSLVDLTEVITFPEGTLCPNTTADILFAPDKVCRFSK